MGNTIRTLLNGDLATISKPEDISVAVAQRLRGHFGVPEEQHDSLNVPSVEMVQEDDSASPYDNYQLGATRTIPQKKAETVSFLQPGSERRRGQATFKKHPGPPFTLQMDPDREQQPGSDQLEDSLTSQGYGLPDGPQPQQLNGTMMRSLKLPDQGRTANRSIIGEEADLTNRIRRKNDRMQTQMMWRLRNQSDMRERVHRIEVKMLENFKRKARNLSSKRLVE